MTKAGDLTIEGILTSEGEFKQTNGSSFQEWLTERIRVERERAEKAETERDQLISTIERARGWATHRVAGFTLENQMAEVADALGEAPQTPND